MRFILGFFLAAFVSTFALLGSLNSNNSWPAVIIAYSAWGIFIWRVVKARKQKRDQRNREQMMDEFLRSRLRR